MSVQLAAGLDPLLGSARTMRTLCFAANRIGWPVEERIALSVNTRMVDAG